jgi:hypothetical protein
MHGVRLRDGVPRDTAAPLPLLTFNSVTLLGAEVFGRWDNWRRAEPPAVYFIWCARLGPKDNFTSMLAELRELTDTYLDGAAVIAFRENAGANGYEPMPMTQRDRRLTVDDVLHRIANQINDLSSIPNV